MVEHLNMREYDMGGRGWRPFFYSVVHCIATDTDSHRFGTEIAVNISGERSITLQSFLRIERVYKETISCQLLQPTRQRFQLLLQRQRALRQHCMIWSQRSMQRSTLTTMRSSLQRLYTSLMPIVPDLLAPANGWLSSMPKTS